MSRPRLILHHQRGRWSWALETWAGTTRARSPRDYGSRQAALLAFHAAQKDMARAAELRPLVTTTRAIRPADDEAAA